MDITFDIRITIGYDIRNTNKKCFVFDYTPSTQDYEEFAKHTGWDNAYDMLVNGNEELAEEIKSDLENNNCYSLDYYLDKHSQRLFEEFLVEKYQDKVEKWLLGNITSKSEMDLNDILNYY